jgi:hypothetical protein
MLFAKQDKLLKELRSLSNQKLEKIEYYIKLDEIDHLKRETEKDDFEKEFLRVHPEVLTFSELHLIVSQYELAVDERDYETLNKIISNFDFFKKFAKPTKIYLLKNAKIVHYDVGDTIF